MKKFEKITRKTNYWLFKNVPGSNEYYYIRSLTEKIDRVIWFIGYKNNHGLVSGVGGDLDKTLQNKLEAEFNIHMVSTNSVNI